MLNIERLPDRKVVILRPDGPLDSKDFEQLAKTIDPIVDSSGKLKGILICARSFPGWTSFGAMQSHLKFIADHHRQIERIGAVTDSGLLKVLSRLAGCVVKPEMKIFAADAEDRALVWLRTGNDPSPAK
jgi:hypothetical protein